MSAVTRQPDWESRFGPAAAARFVYRGLRARWRDQRELIEALVHAVRPGDAVVDVGAHKGAFLFSLARAAAPGPALAIEPQPALASYLRAACAALRLRNVQVLAAAASERAGRARLAIPSSGPTHGASLERAVEARGPVEHVDVELLALDELFAGAAPRLAALKIDVEGHELAVLRGAARLLASHRPTLVVEIEQRHLGERPLSDVFGELERHGYRGEFLHRHRLRPLADFDPALHQRNAGPRFWSAPDYCANFVFRPRA